MQTRRNRRPPKWMREDDCELPLQQTMENMLHRRAVNPTPWQAAVSAESRHRLDQFIVPPSIQGSTHVQVVIDDVIFIDLEDYLRETAATDTE